MPYRELSGEEEQRYETAHDLLEELEALEGVMNSIRNGLGMRET
jgi:hypothetical protein